MGHATWAVLNEFDLAEATIKWNCACFKPEIPFAEIVVCFDCAAADAEQMGIVSRKLGFKGRKNTTIHERESSRMATSAVKIPAPCSQVTRSLRNTNASITVTTEYREERTALTSRRPLWVANT